ncbi:ABC transporter substrate-binding protein [Kocuria sp. M1R5S2]|uniref:ABC transporter substrate-binding protein n=1 Tax=Kocuria rhizosphaerae TaxID=3376285 RepID=UPI00379CB3D2
MRSTRLLPPVTLATTFLLVGCGGGGDATGGDGGTLTLAATSNEKAALDVVVPAFEEANPDIDVEYTTSSLDEYQTTTRTQLSSGTASDIVFVWPGTGNPMTVDTVGGGGFVEDISDHVGDLPEGIAKVMEVDGAAYGAPVSFSGIGAVYNTTAMEEAGLTAPTTRTELFEFCKAAQDAGKSAFALGAQTNWVTQLVPYALTPTLVYGPNPDFAEDMDAGEATFVDSGWEDAMDQYLEMQDAGCFQDNPLGTDYERSLSMVAQGEALGVVQVNSAVPQITGQAPEGTELNMLPLPATDDPEETRMAGAAGSAYAVNASSDNTENALKFIDFIQSPEGMNLYAETNAALPAIPNDEFDTHPALTVLQEYQQEGKTDPFMDQLWPNARVQQTHFAVVQELLGGQTTVQDALAQMDAAYQQGA